MTFVQGRRQRVAYAQFGAYPASAPFAGRHLRVSTRSCRGLDGTVSVGE